jgi:hypothetical protein
MQTNVDLSPHVKEVMNRNNIQIRSLDFVDPKILEKFFIHRKKAILLIRNKVFEREINSLGDQTLDIFDTQLSPYLKKGQSILVVLPTGGKQRYVLQTKIINIFIDRFRLAALDPRDTIRFSFSPPRGVKIRTVCDATTIRIQTGELRVIRHHDGVLQDTSTDNTPRQTGNSPMDKEFEKSVTLGVTDKGEGPTPDSSIAATTSPPCHHLQPSIKDILSKDEGNEKADDFVRLEGQPPIDGTLQDISCGGMCVSLQYTADNNFFIDQLLATECTFSTDSRTPEGSEQLNFFVLAVVRNIKNHQGATLLNLQFLANLPKTIEAYWKEKN